MAVERKFTVKIIFKSDKGDEYIDENAEAIAEKIREHIDPDSYGGDDVIFSGGPDPLEGVTIVLVSAPVLKA